MKIGVNKHSMIYSSRGRQLPIYKGSQIPSGSMVKDGNSWVTLEQDHVIDSTKSEWDNLSQSRIGGNLILREV